MSDLVARARDEAKLWTVLYRDSLLWKMADEIERLQALVDAARAKGNEILSDPFAAVEAKASAHLILRTLGGKP